MNPLQAVALGESNADLVISGGDVLIPETGELSARDVAIKNERVAALPTDATPIIGENTTVLDATGQVVTPGFINAHVHVDSFQPFEQTYHYALAGGTTAVVTETSEFGSSFGAAGVRHLLDATAELPVAVFATVPPQQLFDLFDPQRADETATDELVDLLTVERVVGVGETAWVQIVGRDSPSEALYERAQQENKRIGGHGTGCSGDELTAFASVVTNDHEAISTEQLIERLENGIHAVGRYGSFRDDIGILADAYQQIGSHELSLSTDWIWPEDIVDDGYMDAVIRRAIEEGVDPADAIRMATLNPARHFGLDGRGSLTPGHIADIVLLDDLETVEVDTVVSGGDVVVRDGEPRVEPRPHEYPESFCNSVNVELNDVLHVPETAATEGTVRAIKHEHGPISSETTVEPRVENGKLVAAPERDVLKISLLDRQPEHDETGFTGFITGLGLEEGAVATTHTWQTPGLVAVGASDDAMQTAVNQVAEMNGGWAVVGQDSVRATFPTPIGARCADREVTETAEAFGEIEAAVNELGAAGGNPMLALQSLSFTGVPSLRMSVSGYANVLTRETVGLTI
ncbi:adenine deaminase C-terminal domain-containing protein (plasmid) [Haloarcula sp. NS06]|uniref:adenine deaminase C-terminal domain-containing protein n=1 Tax=Halobacteriales TaxID=2235 RepID=UPI0009B5B0C5|nr:adenine deaminase C-terminal domain-containing protein [Haloparvum sedimenti]